MLSGKLLDLDLDQQSWLFNVLFAPICLVNSNNLTPKVIVL